MPGEEITFQNCVKDVVFHRYQLEKLFQQAIGLATKKHELAELASLTNKMAKYFVELQTDLEKRVTNNEPLTVQDIGQNVTQTTEARKESAKETAIVAVQRGCSQPTQSGSPQPLTAGPIPSLPCTSTLAGNMAAVGANGPPTSNQQGDECKIFIPDIKGLQKRKVREYFANNFGEVKDVQMDWKPPTAVVCFSAAETVTKVLKNPSHTIGSVEIFTKAYKKAAKFHNVTGRPSQSNAGNSQLLLPEYQVFCGGVPPRASGDDIRKALSTLTKGAVLGVIHKGTYAFVDFERAEDAYTCINQWWIQICGKWVELQAAT